MFIKRELNISITNSDQSSTFWQTRFCVGFPDFNVYNNDLDGTKGSRIATKSKHLIHVLLSPSDKRSILQRAELPMPNFILSQCNIQKIKFPKLNEVKIEDRMFASSQHSNL